MNDILKLFFSMSLSGTLLILALFLAKPLYRERTSRQWQYYVWLIVIARLLLPFSPLESISGMLVGQAEQAILQLESAQEPKSAAVQGNGTVETKNNLAGTTNSPIKNGLAGTTNSLPEAEAGYVEDKNYFSGLISSNAVQNNGYASQNSNTNTKNNQETTIVTKAFSHLWVVWLGVAVILFVRKVTIYQSFVKYMTASREEVSDIRLLNTLAEAGSQINVKRPVELYTNKLVSSPLLIGFFHPCIVFPSMELSDTDFVYTVWHELTHYKRLDMFYKWLLQLTMCLHWFNPLVWMMGRELGRACELACDEAVISGLDEQGRRAYGDTLLHALKAEGCCQSPFTSVMLSEDAEQIKERLCVIMNFKKSSKLTILLSVLFTAALFAGATTAGAAVPTNKQPEQPAAVSSNKSGSKQTAAVSSSKSSNTYTKLAEKYYKAENFPAFAEVFSRLDETSQKTWLKKIYKDGEIALFSASLDGLKDNSPLVDFFAKKAYQDGDASFFSVLTDHMDRKTLKSWLSKAEKDKQTAFQMMLYDALDMEQERNKKEAELDKQRIAEYKEHGITVKGKSYYYKGKLVKIFMDIRKDSSFYTLDINPKGTVNVKVTRDAAGKIKKVGRMGKAEAKELLGDWNEEKEDKEQKNELETALTQAGGVKVTAPINISKVKNGEYVWIGTYSLAENDKIYYNVSAKNGKHLAVGFAKAGIDNPSTTYVTVSNKRTDGKLEVKSGPHVWKKPLKSGKYRLFIHTKGGDLEKVSGAVVIVKAEEV